MGSVIGRWLGFSDDNMARYRLALLYSNYGMVIPTCLIIVFGQIFPTWAVYRNNSYMVVWQFHLLATALYQVDDTAMSLGPSASLMVSSAVGVYFGVVLVSLLSKECAVCAQFSTDDFQQVTNCQNSIDKNFILIDQVSVCQQLIVDVDVSDYFTGVCPALISDGSYAGWIVAAQYLMIFLYTFFYLFQMWGAFSYRRILAAKKEAHLEYVRAKQEEEAKQAQRAVEQQRFQRQFQQQVVVQESESQASLRFRGQPAPSSYPLPINTGPS